MKELNEKWSVTFQYHTSNDVLFVKTVIVEADSIGIAIQTVDETLASNMETCMWSDYTITSVCIVPEIH